MFLLFQSATEKFTGSQSHGFASFFSYPIGCVKESPPVAKIYKVCSGKVYTLNGKRKNWGASGAVTRLFVFAGLGKNRIIG